EPLLPGRGHQLAIHCQRRRVVEDRVDPSSPQEGAPAHAQAFTGAPCSSGGRQVGCGAMNPSSRWRRRWWKTGVWLLAVVLPLVLVTGLFGLHAVRRPLPIYDGALSLAGLSAPVTVHRDGHGIPQIYASTLTDLYRAQGFVHAQDRFWEMDFRRHVTSGRLAELFGPDLVETDAFLRTLGWRAVAETEWDLLSPRTREYLTAYAEGVNAWIAQTGGPADTGAKALQYRILGLRNPGYQVAPWDPVDSLAWLKAMAWDLRSNLVYETDRAVLLASGLSREQVEQLYPEYPYAERAPIVTDGALTPEGFDPDATRAAVGDDEPPVASADDDAPPASAGSDPPPAGAGGDPAAEPEGEPRAAGPDSGPAP